MYNDDPLRQPVVSSKYLRLTTTTGAGPPQVLPLQGRQPRGARAVGAGGPAVRHRRRGPRARGHDEADVDDEQEVAGRQATPTIGRGPAGRSVSEW